MTARSSRIVLFFVITIAVAAFDLGIAGGAGAISNEDFIIKAEDGNMLQVSLGEFAGQQGASPEVRQFGQKMAVDHLLSSNKLLEIAKKNNLQVPEDMDRAEHETLIHLQGLKGRDFDRAFMKNMVEDHKRDMGLYEQMAKEGSDPDLKDFAQQNLQTMREHFRMAQDIYRKIEGRE
jgi:putative membrane protein